MTEAELTDRVIRLGLMHGLLVHHCKDSRHCEGSKGMPDLILAGKRGIVFAELKSADGETDACQDLWAWTLSQLDHGQYERQVTYLVWRPSDLTYGVTIEDWMKAIK